MSTRAQKLHNQATVVLAHDHTMMGLFMRRRQGERSVFAGRYAPMFRQGGINGVGLSVGGDVIHPQERDIPPWWGTLALIDMLRQEAEESKEVLSLCLNTREIDVAVAEGKIAAFMILEGAKPISEGPFAESLTNLRTLYRLGVRSIQFCGRGWNPLVDAAEEDETSRGLTPFGRDVVQEMNRLGMLIDLDHIAGSDPLFWEVIEASHDPVIRSHTNVRAVYDNPRNLSDEQIQAIGQKDGVIGINFGTIWINGGTKQSALEDLVRHVDHIAELVGIDAVALGPDMVEPDVVGIDVDSFVIDGYEHLGQVTEELDKRGYSDTDIRKILGENLLRVYRRVMG